MPRARLRALDAPGPGRFNTRPRCGLTRCTISKHPPGQVAQLVEQGTENPRVGGSIPPLATIPYKHLRLTSRAAGLACVSQTCHRFDTRRRANDRLRDAHTAAPSSNSPSRRAPSARAAGFRFARAMRPTCALGRASQFVRLSVMSATIKVRSLRASMSS